MTTRQLWLLGVLLLENVTNAVEKLDVTLLRIRLEGGDEGVGHGASSLAGDGSIGTAKTLG